MTIKSDNFKRLAEKRVTETVKKMRLIGNLANKNNYDYSEAQARKIISTLENELKILKTRFKDESENTSYNFKLDDEDKE